MEKGLSDFIWILVVLVTVIWLIRREHSRAHRNVQPWAAYHGFALVSKKRGRTRWFREGPYEFASDRQVVFRITVLDERSQERPGWVRCGSWLVGPAFPH